MEIIINNEVLLFSATNEETPYEQLQQHRHCHFVGPSRIYKKKNNNNNNAQRLFKIETCEKNMQVNFIVIVLL